MQRNVGLAKSPSIAFLNRFFGLKSLPVRISIYRGAAPATGPA
jgi:hypothetical protein